MTYVNGVTEVMTRDLRFCPMTCVTACDSRWCVTTSVTSCDSGRCSTTSVTACDLCCLCSRHRLPRATHMLLFDAQDTTRHVALTASLASRRTLPFHRTQTRATIRHDESCAAFRSRSCAATRPVRAAARLPGPFALLCGRSTVDPFALLRDHLTRGVGRKAARLLMYPSTLGSGNDTGGRSAQRMAGV